MPRRFSFDRSGELRQSRDSVRDIWGPRSGYEGEDAWPVRVDHALSEEPDRWVQSACVLCSNGCALDIGVKDDRIVGVRGREVDVVNHGRLGPKGLHGWRANNSPDRLTRPLIRKNGRLEESTWDEAMDLIVGRSRELIDRYSSSSIGFYTTGQLMLEEYYTLGVIGKAGLGTPHMDGNTRLCTATAAAALKETFGADGQPGSYRDIDVTDCILLVGHNMAETDTVLWSRILDRRAGARPPKIVAIDTRPTPTTAEADIHLQPRPGTNVALLNGLLNLLIENGHIDEAFVREHTAGFEELKETVAEYQPEKVEELTGVAPDQLREAARVLGEAESLVSTVLQGVYQSMQATAAAVQVNNINLVRGMIGRPGCGILQMNGQPTAQNTRECGADGDLPGFRNWDNPEHVRQLAEVWNVDTATIPHWAPPTHALQIFRYAEQLSIRMLWISGTNPAVSLPDLPRVRSILANPELFVVVQDAFPTETTELADVVLPAAIWGEKTGTFTNVDRTVHISHQAVSPPGEARSDLDIFLDYARRMDFRDKDGQPLVKWQDPEGAFRGWQECSRGRPCDYTGLSYEKLSAGSGIPWPCNDAKPEGSVRIYEDLRFPTPLEECESFGHDLITGAAIPMERYKALDPKGKAFLKAAAFQPPHEAPDDDYPLWLTTGRQVYHFHTRTKTGRSEALYNAAPETFAYMSSEDARTLGVSEGDWVRVKSRRSEVEVRARIEDVPEGGLFMPFHFGYWDEPGHAQAANELTIYEWDAVSKQPHFKYAAVQVQPIESPSSRQPDEGLDEHEGPLTVNLDGARAHVKEYVTLLEASERALAEALVNVAEAHQKEPDVYNECHMLAAWSNSELEQLRSIIERMGEGEISDLSRLTEAIKPRPVQSGFGLVRDLHDCWLLANGTHMSLVVLDQVSKALRDQDMQATLERIDHQNQRQRAWLLTRIKQAAPQALVVPS